MEKIRLKKMNKVAWRYYIHLLILRNLKSDYLESVTKISEPMNLMSEVKFLRI